MERIGRQRERARRAKLVVRRRNDLNEAESRLIGRDGAAVQGANSAEEAVRFLLQHDSIEALRALEDAKIKIDQALSELKRRVRNYENALANEID